jgi:CHAD domain-containing protein
MKARRVKKLDSEGPLADNLERIVRVRLDELESFVPKALDPSKQEALHDMRIAAKRLRYILELGTPALGAYASTAAKRVKELQDILGEIHDYDVLIPRIEGRAGLEALAAHLRAQRVAEFERFLTFWEQLAREGFQARLEFAITERPQETTSSPDDDIGAVPSSPASA